ncbi:hypothetical protein [Anabaena sp. AL09]|uniref:hypothetical protein n=1 Tax=Anabaena sp. AL09 TaxID=1710891 RepID=UPI002613F6C5|nr:hypothetical protein [Anabaena sp. AL09]
MTVEDKLLVVSCYLSVGAKHLEDKLSVIAKNSSPNASPVQLSVVSCQDNWLKSCWTCTQASAAALGL